ncbi:hypothetical protein [Bradyrhizobium septentrionale]|uniref:Uncharacterized protein n=1 Tax=Bradyrhizobium septentrionale TaxID=1404411 RepID=A0ABZ2NYN3_9BRAD
MKRLTIGALIGLLWLPVSSMGTDPRSVSTGQTRQFAVSMADWIDRSLANARLVEGFDKCEKIVALYQSSVLQRLERDAAGATSKADQQRTIERGTWLRTRAMTDRRVACVKQYLISLRITERGYYVDALSLMNWSFKSGKESELVNIARSRLDDLTPSGMRELENQASLVFLGEAKLTNEIESPLKDGLIESYLGCLLPIDWARSSSSEYCHGAELERALNQVAGSMKTEH